VGCRSIDVRRWHREGQLLPGQHFSCSWTYGGKPSGSVSVRRLSPIIVLLARAALFTRGNAKLLQLLFHQARKDRVIHLILAECRLILLEANTRQPDHPLIARLLRML
jgi:hypothetical protein